MASRRHALTHSRVRTCPEQSCRSQTFTTKKDLDRHNQTVHKRGPVLFCRHCLKGYRRKDHLKRHARTCNMLATELPFKDGNDRWLLLDFESDDALLDLEYVFGLHHGYLTSISPGSMGYKRYVTTMARTGKTDFLYLPPVVFRDTITFVYIPKNKKVGQNNNPFLLFVLLTYRLRQGRGLIRLTYEHFSFSTE